MADEYVTRTEFDSLKEDVKEIKKDRIEDQKLWQAMDKKLDVINEKISNSEKVENLRIEQVENDVKKMQGNQEWLWRAVGTTVIGIVIKIIFDVSKLL